jgi:hypothetical protein
MLKSAAHLFTQPAKLHKLEPHRYLLLLNRDKLAKLISSIVRPDAISPTKVPTVTRKPRIQGLPPITSRSNVIRDNCCMTKQ